MFLSVYTVCIYICAHYCYQCSFYTAKQIFFCPLILFSFLFTAERKIKVTDECSIPFHLNITPMTSTATSKLLIYSSKTPRALWTNIYIYIHVYYT